MIFFSVDLNPTEEINTSYFPFFNVTANWYTPSVFDEVPEPVFLICTEAPGTGIPLLSVTFPLMIVWAFKPIVKSMPSIIKTAFGSTLNCTFLRFICVYFLGYSENQYKIGLMREIPVFVQYSVLKC